MLGSMPEENGSRDTRLDRIERALELLISDHEQFRVDLRQLLTAQVLQKAEIEEHTKQILAQSEQIGNLGDQIGNLRAKDAALDERVDKLVSAIGELVRRMPL